MWSRPAWAHQRLPDKSCPPPHAPCSKQIQFGLQTPQETVKCGVFHAYEQNLYKVGTHAARMTLSASS
jgi:hypothetical protein